MELLDEYNPLLSQQQKEQLLHDNFVKINTALQFSGGSIVAQCSNRIQNFTSASRVTLNGMYATPILSGGVSLLIGSMNIQGNNYHAFLILSIDGNDVWTSETQLAPYGVTQQIPIFWIGNLSAGKHTFSLSAYSVYGGGYFGQTTSDSGFTVLELRQG